MHKKLFLVLVPLLSPDRRRSQLIFYRHRRHRRRHSPWTGPYIGAQIGYAWGPSTFELISRQIWLRLVRLTGPASATPPWPFFRLPLEAAL
jgi:hypothetical protein